MMSFGFKKRRRTVIVEALKKVDIKEVPRVDMDKVMDKDKNMDKGMAKVVDHPHHNSF